MQQVIDREDMLELTRRMTVKRNCFGRIAGAYLDEDGFIDGTFNTNFRKLTPGEQDKNLKLAKAIPFSETNQELVYYGLDEHQKKAWGMRRVLMELRDCELKNDALLDSFYEYFGEHYQAPGDYAVYMFHGSYDIPMKASDQESLWESEEVYRFIICAVCRVHGDYEPEEPECGFLFPAFMDHGSDDRGIAVFGRKGERTDQQLKNMLGFEQENGGRP